MQVQQVQDQQQALTRQGELSTDDITALVQAGILPKNVPPAQIKIFAQICREKELSPFSHEIMLLEYSTKDGPKWATITEIAGFRKIADRTERYAGMDEPRFNVKSDGTYLTLSEMLAKYGQTPPPQTTCSVTVYKLVGTQRVPFCKTVILADFDNGRNWWRDKKYHMIAKIGETHSIRAAFGAATSGIRLREEVMVMDETVPTVIPNAAAVVNLPVEELSEADQQALEEVGNMLATFTTSEQVRKFWKDNPQWHRDTSAVVAKIMSMCTARGRELTPENTTQDGNTAN